LIEKAKVSLSEVANGWRDGEAEDVGAVVYGYYYYVFERGEGGA
jgi:hypothetical protein